MIGTNTEIQLKSISLDSVQFTDGNYNYVLTGVLGESGKTHLFSLILDKHPAMALPNNLIKSSFPFPHHSNDSMQCWVFKSGDYLEILWENPTQRLRILIEESTLEH
jgi:hypothetical protein